MFDVVCKDNIDTLFYLSYYCQFCPLFGQDSSAELYFVQWYAISTKMFSVYKIDAALRSVRLWRRNDLQMRSRLYPIKYFGLVLVEFFRRMPPSIKKEWNGVDLESHVEYEGPTTILLDGGGTRISKLFYVTGFLLSGRTRLIMLKKNWIREINVFLLTPKQYIFNWVSLLKRTFWWT